MVSMPDTAESRNILSLNLVVIRSSDAEQAVAFYRCLGLVFARHRHGNGPEHFAAELPGGVFEIYPLSPDALPTSGTRLGFSVISIDRAIEAIAGCPNSVIAAPKESEWGRRAVLADPDGHRVELIESPPAFSKNESLAEQ